MNPEVSSGCRRAILALLATTVLIVVMDFMIINVALNPIQQSLNATNAELQWALDSYLITFAAFLFTGGVCADRFGRKKTLIVGLVVFGVSSVLSAYAHDITELIVWRSIMGVGAAVVPTVTLAIIMNSSRSRSVRRRLRPGLRPPASPSQSDHCSAVRSLRSSGGGRSSSSMLRSSSPVCFSSAGWCRSPRTRRPSGSIHWVC